MIYILIDASVLHMLMTKCWYNYASYVEKHAASKLLYVRMVLNKCLELWPKQTCWTPESPEQELEVQSIASKEDWEGALPSIVQAAFCQSLITGVDDISLSVPHLAEIIKTCLSPSRTSC